MSKILSEYEKNKRTNNSNYYENGKPKESSMLCRNKEYIKEVLEINGTYDINWVCGGNRCPLYATGCDDKGREWQ